MMVFIALTFGKVFYLRCGASLVLCLPFLSWFRWRKFCGLHVVAPGAISHGVPRQRFRVFHVLCAVRRSSDHVSCGKRCPAVRLAWNSCGDDRAGICRWPSFNPVGSGNSRPDIACVTLECKGLLCKRRARALGQDEGPSNPDRKRLIDCRQQTQPLIRNRTHVTLSWQAFWDGRSMRSIFLLLYSYTTPFPASSAYPKGRSSLPPRRRSPCVRLGP